MEQTLATFPRNLLDLENLSKFLAIEKLFVKTLW